MRWKIHEPLALDALDRRNHAFAIRDLAVIPPKLELGAVTVKVFLAQLMEDAVVTALQQGVETFRRVDVLAVDVHVNLRRMVDRGVSASEHVGESNVRREVIGDDFCSCIDVDTDVLAKRNHHANDRKSTTNIHKTGKKLPFNLADQSRRVGKLFGDL